MSDLLLVAGSLMVIVPVVAGIVAASITAWREGERAMVLFFGWLMVAGALMFVGLAVGLLGRGGAAS